MLPVRLGFCALSCRLPTTVMTIKDTVKQKTANHFHFFSLRSLMSVPPERMNKAFSVHLAWHDQKWNMQSYCMLVCKELHPIHDVNSLRKNLKDNCYNTLLFESQ